MSRSAAGAAQAAAAGRASDGTPDGGPGARAPDLGAPDPTAPDPSPDGGPRDNRAQRAPLRRDDARVNGPQGGEAPDGQPPADHAPGDAQDDPSPMALARTPGTGNGGARDDHGQGAHARRPTPNQSAEGRNDSRPPADPARAPAPRPPGLAFPFDPPPPGEAREVAEGVLWLRLPLPMALDHVNVYALDDGDGWTLVDAGMDWPAGRAAWAALRAGPLANRPVRRVILTHHHPDHVGCAGHFVSEGAEIWAPRTAWLFARMLTLDHHDRPPPRQLAFLRRAGWGADRLAAFAQAEPFNFSRVVAPLPPGFRALADGARLRAGGRDWRVRLGGGHAPDHATLWSRDGALALTGDQILPRISPNVGVYATEPEADPMADWLAACARLGAEACDARLALPGHERPFTGIATRLRQLAEEPRAALARLRTALAAGPMTAVDAFDVIYRRPIRSGEWGLATAEAVAHLNWLAARGQAVARDDADGARRYVAADPASAADPDAPPDPAPAPDGARP